MPAAYLWAWDADAGDWVKLLADEHGKLILSDEDPFEIVQDTPEDLKHLPHGSDFAGTPVYRPIKVDAAGHLQHDIITAPETAQATPEDLQHVPHGRVAGNGTYLPLAVDSDGKLQLAIASLPSLNDITDVNVPSLTDGDFIEWDAATSKWIIIAHKDVATGAHGLGSNYFAYTPGSSKEALPKHSYRARAYLGTDQDDIPTGTYVRIEFANESYDPNSGFLVSSDTPIYDNVQADADSDATHIEDDSETFDDDLVRYALVSWSSDGNSTNAGTGYVTAVADHTLTIIKATGDNFGASYYYTINHAEYTVQVTGYHDIFAAIGWEYATTTAGKRYRVIVQGNISLLFDNNFYAADTGGLTTPAAGPVHLTVGDYIKLVGIHYAGAGNEPNIKGSTYITWLAIQLTHED